MEGTAEVGKMKLYAYDKGRDRKILVGEIIENKLVKRVDPEKHLLKKFGCYAIQDSVFEELEGRGVEEIIFIEKGGRKLSSPLFEWLAPNIRTVEFGHGKQRIFSVDRMRAE